MAVVINGYTLGKDFNNPIRRSSHGGGCCGINHLNGFLSSYKVMAGDWGKREWIRVPISKELVEDALRGTLQLDTQGMLVEAVLTNAQCKDKAIIDAVLGAGFKLVARFRNPNSGNICNVFHYNKHPRSLTSRLPYKVKEVN